MSLGLGLALPAFSSTALIRVSDRDAGVADRAGQHHAADRWFTRHRASQHAGGDRHRELHRRPWRCGLPGRRRPWVRRGLRGRCGFPRTGSDSSALLISAGPAEVSTAEGAVAAAEG